MGAVVEWCARLAVAAFGAWVLWWAGCFGCRHTRRTFPQTPVAKDGARGEPYQVCLSCGKRLAHTLLDARIKDDF